MIDIAIKYHSDINMQISETLCHISNKYIYNIITSQNHKLVVFLLENLQQCSMLVTTKYTYLGKHKSKLVSKFQTNKLNCDILNTQMSDFRSSS